MKKKNNSLFDKQLVNTSLVEAFRKLDPRTMIKNPIMFTVELVTAIMLLMLFYIAFTGDQSQGSFGYNLAIFFVLLLTILFANFAEAIAEARGKAQAESLRKTREETPAKLVTANGAAKVVSSSQLKRAMCSNAPQEIRFLPMAKSSKVSPRSTRAPSRVSRLR